MKHHFGVRPAGGLWWAALVSAIAGSAITYVLSLDRLGPGTRHDWTLSLTATVVVVGLCIICATADWWMRR
jgi:hypothetical protein